MGLCIDPDENPQAVRVEVRRESVIITETTWENIHDDVTEATTSAEFSKEYLQRLIEFFKENPPAFGIRKGRKMNEEKKVVIGFLNGPYPWSYKPLPLFDSSAMCPKCAHIIVYTEYKEEWIPTHRYPGDVKLFSDRIIPEESAKALTEAGWRTDNNIDFVRGKLKRTCARCEYSWSEACVESFVEKAKMFAEVAHRDQKYGERPFIIHPADVARIAGQYRLGSNVVAAAWLHDTLEDTDTDVSILQEKFSKEVTDLVEAVTNESGENRKERAKKTLPKIKLAGPDAVALKLCDRISNVQFALADGHTLMKAYKNEYPMFREILYTPGQFEDLWDLLDKLLK